MSIKQDHRLPPTSHIPEITSGLPKSPQCFATSWAWASECPWQRALCYGF
jgi:hypothetical protein